MGGRLFPVTSPEPATRRKALLVGLVAGVLIAGAGHPRTDRGVAWVLRQMQPDVTVAGLMFREVIDALTAPDEYARTLVDTPALPFDYVWFTPRVDDQDPCERFRRELERLRRP